jgi:DNA polymerase-3 subunit alpha
MPSLSGDGSEFAEAEMQIMEHELLGFYVTSHPLKRVANRLRWLTSHSIPEALDASDGTTVILGGLATRIEKKLTKQNKLLCIVELEDPVGKLECVIYSETLDRINADILRPQSLLLIKGKIKKNEESNSILVNSVRRIADASLVNIYLGGKYDFADLHRLKDLLNAFKGEDPVLLHFPRKETNQAILVGSQFWVDASADFAKAIKTGLWEEVKVVVNKVLV